MKTFSIFLALLTISQAHADWKLETLGGMQVHYYMPKKSAFTDLKSTKHALMINLHGCAQKAEDLKKDGNWEPTADDYNMIVALPKAPNGGVYSGCWDYYGADHTPTNRHNGPILSMVKEMLAKSELEIDPAQVYISGLSSGGGEAMVLGCMAPDVFAGIGLNAGPSTGTTAMEISRPSTSYQTMLATCKKLAAGKEEAFKTQLTSIIYGNNDYIVSTAYDINNAEIMRTMYDANEKSTFDTKKLEGSSTDGTGTLFSDAKGPRVSLIMNTNLGHNWPAGQGGNGGNFISKKSINYPAYLAKFFFSNNRRAKSIKMPEVLINPIEVKDSKLKISGEVTIPRDVIQNFEALIRRKSDGELLERLPLVIDNDNRFVNLSKGLSEGQYEVDFELKNTVGIAKIFKRLSWLGEVGGVNPPQLININFQTVFLCADLKGQAVSNGTSEVTKLHALLDNKESFETDVTNTFWELKLCDLKEGAHTLAIHAENEDGLFSTVLDFPFSVSDKTATATVQEHMEAKRLKWEDYGQYFLKYGSFPFTLYLVEGNVWSDKKTK